MNWFVLALIVLACARLTHFTSDDYLLSKPREWAMAKTQKYPHVVYLFSCTWCQSIYWAIGGALAAWQWAGATTVETWLLVPALSYTTVMLEALVEYLYEQP